MKAPRKILVAPFEYTVARVPGLSGAGASGTCSPDDTRILIDGTLSGGAEKDTLLHEILHALLGQTDVVRRLKEVDPNLEEDMVYSLTPRLLSLLLENPELVEYLTS